MGKTPINVYFIKKSNSNVVPDSRPKLFHDKGVCNMSSAKTHGLSSGGKPFLSVSVQSYK